MQNMSYRSTWLLVAGALLAMAISQGAWANPSNKWRLQFSGGAESDGVIVLKITPVGGEPMTVEVAVSEGTGENAVAKTVVEACRKQLPQEAFHVERDDGEDVLLKKRHGAADFDVEIVSNTVKDVRINPDRE
jgi:hypothetical protein